MVKHKHIDRICIGAAVLAVALTLLLMFGERLGIPKSQCQPRICGSGCLDDGSVHCRHTNRGLGGFLSKRRVRKNNVAVRLKLTGKPFAMSARCAKGNNSLRLTEEYGLSSLQLKAEIRLKFLDRRELIRSWISFPGRFNFQDNSYQKTYMAYDMMAFAIGVQAPFCLYLGDGEWGGLRGCSSRLRNRKSALPGGIGNDYGALYKPDYVPSMRKKRRMWRCNILTMTWTAIPAFFENAKFNRSHADQKRLIEAMQGAFHRRKSGKRAVNVDEVLRYFCRAGLRHELGQLPGIYRAQLFSVRGGRRTQPPRFPGIIICLRYLRVGDDKNPVRDPNILINYPINTPAEGASCGTGRCTTTHEARRLLRPLSRVF